MGFSEYFLSFWILYKVERVDTREQASRGSRVEGWEERKAEVSATSGPSAVTVGLGREKSLAAAGERSE